MGLAVDKRKGKTKEMSGSLEVSIIVERSGRRDW